MARLSIIDEADYVIVGSGAGGATVARTLTDLGVDVIIVEEGSHFPVKERTTSMEETMGTVLRGCGLTTMVGRSMIPYLQGRCVGGTTVVNGAIVWRLPEDVHAQWLANDPELAEVHDFESLESCFQTIEDDLGVHEVDPSIAGQANELVRQGCESLGWTGRRIRRNERGCRGSGRCLQGCPIGAKQSMEQSYIPYALSKGARLYSETKVTSIRLQGTRATGVVARQEDSDGKTRYIEIKARQAVVVAAGAVQSAALLKKNRLGNALVGKGLMCHPGVSLAGRFPDPIDPWTGATQGYEVTEHRDQGVKLETLALPPEYGAMRLTGSGPEFLQQISDLNRCAVIGAAIRAKAKGTVRPLGNSAMLVRYSMQEWDVKAAQLALWAAAQVMRAAGAEAVLPSVHGWPEELDAASAPEWIDKHPAKLRDLKVAVTHLMGGTCMGSDPKRSAVSPNLAMHGYSGLYVADAGVFPTNTGVNPQHTIMALAMNAARNWVN